MKRLSDIIKAYRHNKAMNTLHKCCIRGMADKKIANFENISFQTWLELLGIYQMLSYRQPMPAMSKDAQTVIEKIGL